MTTIRFACLADADRIRELLQQLGYPADLALVQGKLAALAASDAVLVAEELGRVVAVASLHTFDLFHEAGRIGKITSFVVDAEIRGRGVGSMLLDAADEFFPTVRVHSGGSVEWQSSTARARVL